MTSSESGKDSAGGRVAPLRRITTWLVRPEHAESAAAGFAIEGDDRPLLTPDGRPVVVPSRTLAEAIVAELRAQAEAKVPNIAAMPNLRLAATAIDCVAAARDATIDAVAAYGATELLCYRAEHPADLIERQHAAWQPLLDWAAARFDAPLVNAAGIMPRGQPDASLAALRAAVAAEDDLRLAALAFAVQTSGSLVVGLAMLHGRLNAAEAFALAELEETYQIEKWGEDSEATARRAQRRRDLLAAATFMALIKST